jgi:aerobic carbon-monoxide dehydrogenase small subunit
MLDELVKTVLTVNGERKDTWVLPNETLVDTLRNRLGLTGTPTMCHEGSCGSCTVLINGQPVLSCLTLTLTCENKAILTIEGLADQKKGVDLLHPVQKAFVDNGGMQCGICTPGIILTSVALLNKNPAPTENEIREALAGNLCRCGNYKGIIESVLAASEYMKGDTQHG